MDRDHACQGLARNNTRGFLGGFLQRQVQIPSYCLLHGLAHGVLLVVLFHCLPTKLEL